MFTKGGGTKEVRSKIRVYYRVFMVRSSDDFVFLLTQKNTREKYSLSLSLTQRQEGKKGGHHAVAAALSVVSFPLAFRGVVFAVVMGVTDVKVRTF